MKRTFSIISVMLLGLFLGACSGENDSQMTGGSVLSQPMSEPATISAEVSSNQGKRVVIQGTSNLPDKTQLFVSLKNEIISFRAEKKVMVLNGQFYASLVAPKDGLTPGDYRLDVVLPVAAGQPESVQKVIGNQGQHLTGSLTKDISWGGRILEATFPYTVDG